MSFGGKKTGTVIIKRLLLPGAMALFLLLSLAYWWLDNLPHEVFGIALFGLLVWHIAVNRFWFRNLFRGRYDARRVITVVLHLALIINMVVLLITSIAISKAVFAFLPIADSTALRDIHWFSAYWVMIIVGIHIGLHWTRVMATSAGVLGLSQPSLARKWLLRAGAAALLVLGFTSWTVLDVWNKLTFTPSMAFWDFTASVSPFFGHWVGVVSLPAVAAHHMMVALRTNIGLRRP